MFVTSELISDTVDRFSCM